jgi:hypothetical protein
MVLVVGGMDIGDQIASRKCLATACQFPCNEILVGVEVAFVNIG